MGESPHCFLSALLGCKCPGIVNNLGPVPSEMDGPLDPPFSDGQHVYSACQPQFSQVFLLKWRELAFHWSVKQGRPCMLVESGPPWAAGKENKWLGPEGTAKGRFQGPRADQVSLVFSSGGQVSGLLLLLFCLGFRDCFCLFSSGLAVGCCCGLRVFVAFVAFAPASPATPTLQKQHVWNRTLSPLVSTFAFFCLGCARPPPPPRLLHGACSALQVDLKGNPKPNLRAPLIPH